MFKKKKINKEEVKQELPQVTYIVDDIHGHSAVREPIGEKEYFAMIYKYYDEQNKIEAEKELERKKKRKHNYD